VLFTEWSARDLENWQSALLLGAAIGSVVLTAIAFIQAPGPAVAIVAGIVAVIGTAFMLHSSLAVAFTDGTEFAVDARLQRRAEGLRDTVNALAAERNGTVVVQADLRDELGWTLRDSPVEFGGAIERAPAVLARAEAPPLGFAGLEEVWRVSEGWNPDDLPAPRRMWRWMLHREPYGDVDAVDMRIYVRTI
jgi:hypothetical protein